MFHSERRRGMPLTGWSFAQSCACASRVFGVCASVGSDRGAIRRIRKGAALGASAALTLLPCGLRWRLLPGRRTRRLPRPRARKGR